VYWLDGNHGDMLKAYVYVDEDFYDRNDSYYVFTLLEAMLPSPEQLRC